MVVCWAVNKGAIRSIVITDLEPNIEYILGLTN